MKKEIVLNHLVRMKMCDFNVSVRRVYSTVRTPHYKGLDGDVVKVLKSFGDQTVIALYTVQGKEIKVASVEVEKR